MVNTELLVTFVTGAGFGVFMTIVCQTFDKVAKYYARES